MHEYAVMFHPPLSFVFLVIVHMEGSGKWPSEHLALRHIKAAFHICLGELLYKQHQYKYNATPAYLDVSKVMCALLFMLVAIVFHIYDSNNIFS